MGPKERAILSCVLFLSPAVITFTGDWSRPIPEKSLMVRPLDSTYDYRGLPAKVLEFSGPEGQSSVHFYHQTPLEGDYTLHLNPALDLRRGLRVNIWNPRNLDFDLTVLLKADKNDQVKLKVGYGRPIDPTYPVRTALNLGLPSGENQLQVTWGSNPNDKNGTVSRIRKVIWNGRDTLNRLAVPSLPFLKAHV